MPAGSVVFGVSVWWSVRRDFGNSGAGGGFVDDGLVGGERGAKGLQAIGWLIGPFLL
jgi:hypothetical protein